MQPEQNPVPAGNPGVAAAQQPLTGSALGLAMAFGRLRDELAGADTRSTFEAVTAIAKREVPRCTWASLTIKRGQSFRTEAATDDEVRRADALQYELNSGPCVDAVEDEPICVAGDVVADSRWPVFGPRVHAELGVSSILSFRLTSDDDQQAVALNLYALDPSAFDENDLAMSLLLATHGALALSAATHRERADNLAVALDSNRDIATAVGIVMSRHFVTREQAFDLLRICSQRTHRKLHSLALDVIDTGELKLPDMQAPAQRAHVDHPR